MLPSGRTLGNCHKIIRRRGLADVLIDLGQNKEAIIECGRALLVSKQSGDRLGECNALGTLGRAYRYSGAVTKAMEAYDQELAIAQEIEYPTGRFHALG